MKRVKSDQIHAAVGHYLKRRHYMETSDSVPKRDLRSTQKLLQVALNNRVCLDGSTANAIAYSCISGDVTACDQQYVKFRSFLLEAVEPHRSHLLPLLYPVFVHIYLELVGNGQKTPAHKFCSRHKASFEDNASEQQVVEQLQRLHTKDDILSSRKATEFKENRYEVQLPEDTINYLFRYLKNEDNVLMMQIFSQHISIKLQKNAADDTHAEDPGGDHISHMTSPVTPDNKVIRNETNLSSLQRCITRVRDGPPCLASVCFYTFINTYQGLCSVSASREQDMISASYEDGSIRLWKLTPGIFKTSPSEVNISHVNLSCDLPEDLRERHKTPGENEVVSLLGHCGAVYSTSFTQHNAFLLSASEDTTVRLWDMKTHTNKAIYRGHNYPVWDIDASEINGYFASCSHDRTAKLWSTDRTYPLRTFVGHVQDVDCIKFHPNANYIATGSSDKTVRLWNIQDGRPVRLFQGHRSTIHALAFSPNGQYLASAGEDRRVKVWDLSTGNLVKDLRGHTDTVYALAFDQDNSMLASGGLDCMLRVWDIRKSAGSNSLIDGHTSAELLGAFPTRSTTVHCLRYARYNLLYAAGSMPS